MDGDADRRCRGSEPKDGRRDVAEYFSTFKRVQENGRQEKELHIVGEVPDVTDARLRSIFEIIDVQNIVPPIFVASSRQLSGSGGDRTGGEVKRQRHSESHEYRQGGRQTEITMRVHGEDGLDLLHRRFFLVSISLEEEISRQKAAQHEKGIHGESPIDDGLEGSSLRNGYVRVKLVAQRRR